MNGKTEASEGNSAEMLQDLSVALLCDAMDSLGAMSPSIRPLWTPMWAAGPAFTVETTASDNMALHLAVNQAPPGSILVVQVRGGGEPYGAWGEVMTAAAQYRGIAGLVTETHVRDARGLISRRFPVFCRGRHVRRTAKQDLGTLQQPIVCGGVPVNPGDWIVGDDDGVVVIPRESLEEVVAKARKQSAQEKRIIAALKEGRTTLELLGL